MKESHPTLLLRVIQSSLLVILFVSIVNCGIEESTKKKLDANSTNSSIAILSPNPIDIKPELIGEFQDSEILELLLQKHLDRIIPEISKSIPEPISVDYARLENSFLKMLLENKENDNQRKYQFICDENERWIYRCNIETGEIECFSMSSNKLRLLSSVK